MRSVHWTLKQFRKLLLFPGYFRALAKEWNNILFGETLIGVLFLLWWSLANPPNSRLIFVFVAAMFVAGYYAWRADHVKLLPTFKVEKIIPQVTETEAKGTTAIYLQVVPECLTEAPLEECQGWLLLVSRPDGKGGWAPTEMNAPLKLGWDYYGYDPLTIHPGIAQRLDVCFWDNHFTGVVPTVTPMAVQVEIANRSRSIQV